MKFSKEFLASAITGDKEKCRTLAPIIRRCAVMGSAKAKAPQHQDDVEQELWIFLTQHKERLDESYNIEPYLVETARNIARSYQRKFASYGTEDDARAEDAADEGSAEKNGEEATDDLVESTDQQAAMAYLLANSPALRATAHRKADTTMQTQATTQETTVGTAARKRTREQDALRRLRVSAGLTQPAMATLLGLKIPTYQAYEYARTKSVPKAVMDKAKSLTIDPQRNYVMALYNERPMVDVANEWARRMGIAENSPAELAAALGINKSTTSRWLNPAREVQLGADEIIMYERRVAQEEAYYRSSRKRRQRLAVE